MVWGRMDKVTNKHQVNIMPITENTCRISERNNFVFKTALFKNYYII